MKALLVEDDTRLAGLLARVLTEDGFGVDTFHRGQHALKQAQVGGYDIIVLDWMLPDIDGLSVCRELRAKGVATPILMLTARGETRDRVLGLETGADDYVVKPFEIEELVARVHALVRRASAFGRFEVGPLVIDRLAHRVSVAGRAVELTTKEYELLVYLATRLHDTVPKSELLVKVWSTAFDPGSNLVEVTVSRLRDKLGAYAWMVETVRGRGYRCVEHPRESRPPPTKES